MRLILAECGPATLTTTGASIVSPAASVTPWTRPAARRIALTSLLKRNSGTLGLGGALGIVGRQLRIVDVARERKEHPAPEAALGLAERRIVRPLGRPEPAELVERQALPDLLRPPVLPGDAERIHVPADPAQMAVGLGLHDQAAALHELGKAALVRDPEIARPRVPIEETLVGERRAVERRVVGADDRARRPGRAVARGRQLVEVERPPATLGELEGRAGADDPGADDDRVVALAHARIPARRPPKN